MPDTRAGSHGGCTDELMVGLVGGGSLEAASGDVVDPVGGAVEGRLAGGDGLSGWEPAAQLCVLVLDEGPLPGRVGVGEVDRYAGVLFDAAPAGEFAALVPGEAATQLRGDTVEEEADDDLGGVVGVAAFG